jgi:hypothetical protein
MLKIWLTWLQPSLGVLGTALVLSNPLCTYAATKPAVRAISKAPAQVSQWSTIKSEGTRIDRELLSGIAATPDLAVRQLAINAMKTPTMAATSATPTARPNRNSVASFVAPGAKFPTLSSARAPKSTKTQKLKSSDVASALARAINPQAKVPVPGLYIGNSDVRVASKFLPTGKSVPQPVATATEIGSPTPLSAMMAGTGAVDPFPVVRPELMQKLERNLVAANRPAINSAPYALDPVATIPPVKTQAVAPKTLAPQAKAAPYQSLDPIAAIPSGLQQVLGNNLNSSQPTMASTPVAKANGNKANAMVALGQLVSPLAEVAPTAVNAASLQLATAQAYTSAPKFDIPGETSLTAKQLKPIADFAIVKRTQKNFAPSVASIRKSNYATILAPAPKQSWTAVNERNNLGGLILGSQPLDSTPRLATLLPTSPSTSTGLPARALVGFN